MILLAYRPGGEDEHDPKVAEALALADSDPALQHWLDEHLIAQQAIRETVRQIPVPAGLRENILANSKIVHPTVWLRRKTWLSIAAALALLLGFAGLWLTSGSSGAFYTFRDRMVRKVLREYTMDIVTSDMGEIRRFLLDHGAPGDYSLPPGLNRYAVLGAGVHSWQGQRISMVCLDGGAQGTLFLFVVDSGAVQRPPGASPEFAAVSKLTTASWTGGGRSYVLAGTGGADVLRKTFGN
jgi:hypothetical protein